MMVYAVIPAAGSGRRMNLDTPKQFVKVNGRELICFTLDVFEKSSSIDEIVIATSPGYFDLFDLIIEREGYKKITKVIEGGAERQDSVFNALCALRASDDDLVAVHDAARPLLPLAVLENGIAVAKTEGSALVALKAKDTIVFNDNESFSYLNREQIFTVQTPQVFKFSVLIKAFNFAKETGFKGTDESSIVNHLGSKIKLVDGSSLNFKVTTNDDLEILKKIIC